MAPLAIISSGTVESAFINPKTFDIVNDAIGYGIANAYMGGNISLIQSIIEIF